MQTYKVAIELEIEAETLAEAVEQVRDAESRERGGMVYLERIGKRGEVEVITKGGTCKVCHGDGEDEDSKQCKECYGLGTHFIIKQ